MYFITNYPIQQAKDWAPTRRQPKRKIALHERDRDPSSSVYFCHRDGKNRYYEIGSKKFFQVMKGSDHKEILLYIHGFSNQPEENVFSRAQILQNLCNAALDGSQKSIEVIPLLWPCDDDMGILKDYWDDQDSSDKSAFSFARVLGKFMTWREKNTGDNACYRPINILAHSMGNRVLRLTLERWINHRGNLPALFRNVFMVAADVTNETLEFGESGYAITQTARNVLVYYANDDLAMSASKVAKRQEQDPVPPSRPYRTGEYDGGAGQRLCH